MIIRHTFRRPREVVLLGAAIYSKYNSDLANRDAASEKLKYRLRATINEKANKSILDSYQSEIFPIFNKDYLDEFCECVRSNMIEREDILKLNPDMINYMYRLGLLGYVDRGRQQFLPPLAHIYAQERNLPVSDYYLVHPSLDLKFLEKTKLEEYYNKYNIIGHGRRFEPPNKDMRHFVDGHTLQHFKPNHRPGRGTEEHQWRSARIFVSADELYQRVFMGDLSDDACRLRHQRIMESTSFLTSALLLWSAQQIEQAYHADLTDWKEKLKRDILYYKRSLPYDSRISQIHTGALDQFTERIFGRLVVTGLILALGESNAEAKSMVIHFDPDIDPNIHYTASDVTYLRHAFFLAHLPEKGALTTDQARKLWEGLSDCERQMLSDWFRRAVQYTVLPNENFVNEDHQVYLESQLRRSHLAKIIDL
ncbi:MAG: hypothetical protein AAGF87_05860 [Bacteroidota bacterium]